MGGRGREGLGVRTLASNVVVVGAGGREVVDVLSVVLAFFVVVGVVTTP